MSTLPQLIEEDVQQFDLILRDLIGKSEASSAMIIDKGGFLITHRSTSDKFDLTTVAALASGAYLANQTIANLVHEENFNSVYQQGEKNSIFVLNVDEYCLLVVIFPAQLSVGAVKYFSLQAGPRIASQLSSARNRSPEGGLDLSELNVADPAPLFKRKKSSSRGS